MEKPTTGYNCSNCGDAKKIGDDCWKVRIVTADGSELYVPACSEDCALKTQQEYLAIHKRRVDSIKHQQFQRMEWGKY